MKYSKKRSLSLFAFVFVVALLLNSSFGNTHAQIGADTLATNTTQKLSLSDYNNRLLNYLGENLSAADLKNLKTEWAQQIEHNQEVIQATHGSVLNFSLPININATDNSAGSFSSLDTLNGCYIAEISPSHLSPPEDYGYINNPSAIEGSSDNNFARLVTDGWNGNYQNPMGGEAFAASWMQTTYSGDIYIEAKRTSSSENNPPWKDIVMVMGSNSIDTPYGDWAMIGEMVVNSPSPSWVWAGNTEGYSPFTVIAVMCWTPPPYPNSYTYPDYFNDVEIDAVYATNSGPCSLGISTDGGGTTDPSSNYVDYGTQVQVTAQPYDNYAFDHWTLNGVDCYCGDTIAVTMLRSEMDLEAHFSYAGPPVHWLYISATDYPENLPVYPAIYVDGNLVGYGSVYMQISEGYHSVYLEETTWDYWYWSDLGYLGDGYGNGDYRPIYSNFWGIQAIYYPES
jgi:hypothetical protein